MTTTPSKCFLSAHPAPSSAIFRPPSSRRPTRARLSLNWSLTQALNVNRRVQPRYQQQDIAKP